MRCCLKLVQDACLGLLALICMTLFGFPARAQTLVKVRNDLADKVTVEFEFTNNGIIRHEEKIATGVVADGEAARGATNARVRILGSWNANKPVVDWTGLPINNESYYLIVPVDPAKPRGAARLLKIPPPPP